MRHVASETLLLCAALCLSACGASDATTVSRPADTWRVGGRCALKTRNGETKPFRVVRHLPGNAGRGVFIVKGEDGTLTSVVRAGGKAVALVPTGATSQDIVRYCDDGTEIRTTDAGAYEGGCQTVSSERPALAPGIFLYCNPIEVDPPESDGKDTLLDVIDILVAYDSRAQQWLEKNGWEAGLFAETQVAKMNVVLESSGLLDRFRFRLVGTRNLTTSVANMGTSNDLRFSQVLSSLSEYSRQTLQAGTGLRGLLEARHAVGADIAVLLADTGSTSGTLGASYGLLDSTTDWSSDEGLAKRGRLAFAVCEIGSVESGQTMTHEVGHILGAGHPTSEQVDSEDIQCGPQFFDYSSAYLFDYGGKRHFTVMGYPFDGRGNSGFTPVPVFSSPYLTYVDGETDTKVRLGVAGVHDNVRTLSRTYAAVARYRTHVTGGDDYVERTLRVTATAGGTAAGGGTYCAGETAQIVAKCKTGYCFAGWHAVAEPGVTNVLTKVDDYRAPTCELRMGTNDLSVVAVFVRKDKAADPVSAIGVAFDPALFEAGVACDIAAAVSAVSASRPAFSASRLPPGLKLSSSARLSGTPTKPGRYLTAFTAKNESGSKLTREVELVVGNWRDEALPFAESYGPFVPGVPLSLDFSAFAKGCAASGLASGVKWNKTEGILSGTPTKPGTNMVVFTRTDRDVAGAKVGRKASMALVVGPCPTLTLTTCGNGTGKLSGAGAYAANRKVVLRATRDTRKSAFAGWWDAEGNLLSIDASVSYVMPRVNTTLFGRFVTAEEDAASVSLCVGGVRLSADVSAAVTNLCGVALAWPVEPDALSATKVSVSGLPLGVKYDAKAGLLTGAPTAASKCDSKTGELAPSKVRIKVTTAGGTTRTYGIDLFVMPLPTWAVGTFDGGGEGLTLTLTTTKAGKLSGKLQQGADTWALSSACFAAGAYEAAEGADGLSVDVLGKCGRRIVTNAFDFAAAGVAGTVDGMPVTAVRNPWTAAEYKAFAKRLKASGPVQLDEDGGAFVLTFTDTGAVIAVGAFAGGYRASVTAPLCVVGPCSPEEGFRAVAYLHYPPKAAKGFAGFDGVVDVGWTGTSVTAAFVPREK